MSSLGIASVTSQMKKSCMGCRSGRRGERVGVARSFMVPSCFYTGMAQLRAFTQKCQASCFHTGIGLFRAFTHACQHRVSTQKTSCIYTGHFVHLHRSFRVFTRKTFLKSQQLQTIGPSTKPLNTYLT